VRDVTNTDRCAAEGGVGVPCAQSASGGCNGGTDLPKGGVLRSEGCRFETLRRGDPMEGWGLQAGGGGFGSLRVFAVNEATRRSGR